MRWSQKTDGGANALPPVVSTPATLARPTPANICLTRLATTASEAHRWAPHQSGLR